MGLTRAVALPFLHGVCHVTFVAVELRQDRVMMLCSSPPREARCAGTGGELLCDSELTKLSLRSHPFSAAGHASTQPAQPVRKLPCRSLTKLIARALSVYCSRGSCSRQGRPGLSCLQRGPTRAVRPDTAGDLWRSGHRPPLWPCALPFWPLPRSGCPS